MTRKAIFDGFSTIYQGPCYSTSSHDSLFSGHFEHSEGPLLFVEQALERRLFATLRMTKKGMGRCFRRFVVSVTPIREGGDRYVSQDGKKIGWKYDAACLLREHS